MRATRCVSPLPVLASPASASLMGASTALRCGAACGWCGSMHAATSWIHDSRVSTSAPPRLCPRLDSSDSITIWLSGHGSWPSSELGDSWRSSHTSASWLLDDSTASKASSYCLAARWAAATALGSLATGAAGATALAGAALRALASAARAALSAATSVRSAPTSVDSCLEVSAMPAAACALAPLAVEMAAASPPLNAASIWPNMDAVARSNEGSTVDANAACTACGSAVRSWVATAFSTAACVAAGSASATAALAAAATCAGSALTASATLAPTSREMAATAVLSVRDSSSRSRFSCALRAASTALAVAASLALACALSSALRSARTWRTVSRWDAATCSMMSASVAADTSPLPAAPAATAAPGATLTSSPGTAVCSAAVAAAGADGTSPVGVEAGAEGCAADAELDILRSSSEGWGGGAGLCEDARGCCGAAGVGAGAGLASTSSGTGEGMRAGGGGGAGLADAGIPVEPEDDSAARAGGAAPAGPGEAASEVTESPPELPGTDTRCGGVPMVAALGSVGAAASGLMVVPVARATTSSSRVPVLLGSMA
mmetsp:Transcript_11915/g.29212  ORF Transcript_11915/g.29212 Transcript_11915/m.29212 type:complete len:551 (-) Transcript_11915:1678-3330(-)